MPYASKAQARFFHSNPKLKKYTAEFDAATDFNSLPERLHPHTTKFFHPKHQAKVVK